MEKANYPLDGHIECERLEKQAVLEGIERHLQHLPVPERGEVLDAGCGSGAMVRLLASRNPTAHIVGVDINSSFVAYAASRAASEGIANASFEQGDVQNLPFEAGVFDLIWSHLVLSFVPNPSRAIAEFRRVLKPGGRLAVAVLDWPFLNNYPEDPFLQPTLDRFAYGVADFDLSRKLPGLLREAGYKNVGCDIQTDPIWHIVGRPKPEQRENTITSLTASMAKTASILGSTEKAARFLADFLAYIDRPDTDSFNTLWIATATA